MGASPFFFSRPFRIRKRMANVSCLMRLKFLGLTKRLQKDFASSKIQQYSVLCAMSGAGAVKIPVLGFAPERVPDSLQKYVFHFCPRFSGEPLQNNDIQ